MRKISLLLFLFLLVRLSGFAQKATASDTASLKAAEEMKTTLVEKMRLSATAAAKIVDIENEFHTQLQAIEALGAVPVKDKEVKLQQAHTARRATLMALPLTGRQMEDVIDLSEHLRRLHKL